MNPKQTFYKITAEKIIENMKKRQIEGYYCATAAEASELAMSFVKPGMTVSNGGTMTATDMGMLDALKDRNDITFLDRRDASTPEEITRIYHESFDADCYFMSTNAITREGELVNIDGTGNRVACLIYGPKTVIILCGMNKAALDVNDAYLRVKNIASPPNAIRLNRNTPCALTGKCGDCFSPDCICSHTVVTRRCAIPGRIKVILIGEELGY